MMLSLQAAKIQKGKPNKTGRGKMRLGKDISGLKLCDLSLY